MLINNAGVVSGRALLDTPDHLIERSFNVNVLAHFWVSYYCGAPTLDICVLLLPFFRNIIAHFQKHISIIQTLDYKNIFAGHA